MAKKHTDTKLLRREGQQLPCPLTGDELLEKGQQLADIETRLHEHNANAEQLKKELKAKETAILAERARLAGIVKAKTELREVSVNVEAHFDARELLEVRQDTGQIVFRRPLRTEELQGDLLPSSVLVFPSDEEAR